MPWKDCHEFVRWSKSNKLDSKRKRWYKKSGIHGSNQRDNAERKVNKYIVLTTYTKYNVTTTRLSYWATSVELHQLYCLSYISYNGYTTQAISAALHNFVESKHKFTIVKRPSLSVDAHQRPLSRWIVKHNTRPLQIFQSSHFRLFASPSRSRS